MTEALDWDSFGTGDFVKFDKIGTKVAGTLTTVRVGQDFNGNPCPVLDIDTTDGPRTVTCGQANLKAQIVAAKPKVGSRISIEFASEAKAEKGMKKVFDVKIEAPSDAPF